MSVWTWVLIGLCALGVILPLVPFLAVLRLALRLRSRLSDLQQARLFTSLESLKLQRAHLEATSARAAALAARAQAALTVIRGSAESSGYLQMRDAMQSAGSEIESLVETLR